MQGLKKLEWGLEGFWGFPEIRGTLLGVLITRIKVFGGSILGSPYFGKLPYYTI